MGLTAAWRKEVQLLETGMGFLGFIRKLFQFPASRNKTLLIAHGSSSLKGGKVKSQIGFVTFASDLTRQH